MRQAISLANLPPEYWVKNHKKKLVAYMTKAMNANEKSTVVLPEGFLKAFAKINELPDNQWMI